MIAAVLVIAFAMIGWFGATTTYERRFEEAVEALRESGAVVDFEAFGGREIPVAKNAAPLLLSACKWAKDNDLDSCDAANDTESDEEWKLVEGWIDALAPFFERVEPAAAMPECDFELQRELLWEAKIDSIPVALQVREALRWRTRVAERRGAPAMLSLPDCATLLRLSRGMDRGLLLSYCVSVSLDAEACGLLRRIATMPEFDAVEAQRLLEPLLTAAEDNAPFRAALDGERASMIAVIRRLGSAEGGHLLAVMTGDPDLSSGMAGPALSILRPLIWRNGIEGLQFWERANEIIATGDLDASARLAALQQDYSREPAPGPFSNLSRVMTGMFDMVPASAYKYRLRHLATLRVARAGLSALAHHQRHGAWPENSGTLKDPYTGKPLTWEAPARVAAAGPDDEPIAWELP